MKKKNTKKQNKIKQLYNTKALVKIYTHFVELRLKIHKHIWLPFITWFIYGICVLLLYIAYYYGNIALIEVFWDTGTTLLIPIVGIIFFREGLTTIGYFGLILTVIGGLILGLAQVGKL